LEAVILQPRHRREHIGELVQIDGSEHRWFEDRAAACTLLVTGTWEALHGDIEEFVTGHR